MNKHLLVTGGAGFIGANFISYLLTYTEYYITNVDSLTYAGINVLEDSNRYRLLKCDIGNKEELAKCFDQDYEAIINFAAESHVDRSIQNAAPFIHSNIVGTFHLLQALLKGKAKKMIQISTDEVYGSLNPTDSPFHEETPLAPNNPYSATKASADLLVRSFYETYKLPLIITRCCNNYGPMQHMEKFIPTIITNALNDKEIPIYGDGMNIREWIYVEDHCRALFHVLEKGREGEVYHIGSGEEKTNLEVAQIILKKLNKNMKLLKFVEDRKGHDRRYAMDSSKISEELGWSPNVSFHEGIEKTIEWYMRKLNGRR